MTLDFATEPVHQYIILVGGMTCRKKTLNIQIEIEKVQECINWNWTQKRKDTLRLTRLCSFGGQFWWTNDVESLLLVARTRTGGGLNSRNFNTESICSNFKIYLFKLWNIFVLIVSKSTNDVESLLLVARTRTGGGLNRRNFNTESIC